MSGPEPSKSSLSVHQPVMLREVLNQLDLSPDLVVVDGTVGGGGHSLQILKRLDGGGRLIGLDRDPMMLRLAEMKLKTTTTGEQKYQLAQSSYAEMRRALDELGVEKVDRILVDFGFSSDQLEDGTRGFRFDAEGPLDLRFDVTRGQAAHELIQACDVQELAEILEEYGEEPRAAPISQLIKTHFPKGTQTAKELAELLETQLPASRTSTKTHPATLTFQALRIAVNQELDHISQLLTHQIPLCLKPGGRLVTISFHSLEDRLVKKDFQERDKWTNVLSKPITPRPAEVRMNPRSRSAKVRAATLK